MGTKRGRILVWSVAEIEHNWRVKVLRIKEWWQIELRREASGASWWWSSKAAQGASCRLSEEM